MAKTLKILNLFKLEQKDVKDICKIRCAVNNLHNKNNEKYNMCFNLQEMWDDYKQKFYDCITYFLSSCNCLLGTRT